MVRKKTHWFCENSDWGAGSEGPSRDPPLHTLPLPLKTDWLKTNGIIQSLCGVPTAEPLGSEAKRSLDQNLVLSRL
jgi:hypothetical protein